MVDPFIGVNVNCRLKMEAEEREAVPIACIPELTIDLRIFSDGVPIILWMQLSWSNSLSPGNRTILVMSSNITQPTPHTSILKL